jgi:hypothetical protein
MKTMLRGIEYQEKYGSGNKKQIFGIYFETNLLCPNI